jgi:hypothetical protein
MLRHIRVVRKDDQGTETDENACDPGEGGQEV